MDKVTNFEMPKYSTPEVAGCLVLVDFAAFVPLLPTCGGVMLSV